MSFRDTSGSPVEWALMGDLEELLGGDDAFLEPILADAATFAAASPQSTAQRASFLKDKDTDVDDKKQRRRAQYSRAARKSREKHRAEFDELKRANSVLRAERDTLIDRLRQFEAASAEAAAAERDLGNSAARQQHLFARAVESSLRRQASEGSEPETVSISLQTMDFACERLSLVWERRLTATERWSLPIRVACGYPGAGMTVRFSDRSNGARCYWYEFMFLSPPHGNSDDCDDAARSARNSIVSVWTNRETLHGACPMTASNVATREIFPLPEFSAASSLIHPRRLQAWGIRERPLAEEHKVVDWICLVSCDDGSLVCTKSQLLSGFSAERILAESAPPSVDMSVLIEDVLDKRVDSSSQTNVFTAYRSSFRNVATSGPGTNPSAWAEGEHDLTQGLRVWSEPVCIRGQWRSLTHVLVLSLEGSKVDLAHMGGKYGLVDEHGCLTAGMHQVGRGFIEIMFPKKW